MIHKLRLSLIALFITGIGYAQPITVKAVKGGVYLHEENKIVKLHENDNIKGKKLEIKDDSFLIWENNGEIYSRGTKGVFMPDTISNNVMKQDEPESFFSMVWNLLVEEEKTNNAEIKGMGVGLAASVSRGGDEDPMFYNGIELKLVPNADFLLVWPKFDQENYKVSFYDIKLEKLVLDTLVLDTVFLADFETIKKCQYCEVSIDVEDFVYANMYFDEPADSVLNTQLQLNALLSEGEGYNYLLAMYYNDLKYHHNMLAYFYKTMQAYAEEKHLKENWNSFFK